MFTVKNTLFGAIAAAATVLLSPFLLNERIAGPMAAQMAMMHVWLLLGHRHLKQLAREGKPANWHPFFRNPETGQRYHS